MDLIAIDGQRQLFLSPDVEDWQAVANAGITAIIDVDGGLDEGCPQTADGIVYVYLPFNDCALPNLARLHAIGRLGANLIAAGDRVLVHCQMGFNRSALVVGIILRHLGIVGPDAVSLIRAARPGALYNPVFAEYLLSGAPES